MSVESRTPKVRHAYDGLQHSQEGPFSECLLCRIEELEKRLLAEIQRDGVIPFTDAVKESE